jgi:magnesium-transporting ATPase (P-type)
MGHSSPPHFHLEDPHALPHQDVLSRLASTPDGLDTAEAQKRLEQVGPNRLPEPPKTGVLLRFLKHFHDVLIYILLGAAAITAVLGHWVDTSVILGVVVINAIIGFIQEGKAERALEGIRKMLSLHAQARRDGQWVNLDADQLVPGDIVRLRSGDRVPADLRMIETNNLRIEESALTGESVPTDKRTDPAEAAAGVGDRHSMAFSGSMIAAGRGTGVVTGTGPTTELGRINQMMSEVETLATPLTRQMNHFGKWLSVAILGLAAMMFLIGWLLHDFSLAELFFAAIGFAVAAIPEGLPAILTITLAIGVQRMAQRNAITRRLNAVETLGSVTVICSDKTGTLTRNEMTASRAVTTASHYSIEGNGYAPQGSIKRNDHDAPLQEHADLHALVEVMTLCNDSEITETNGQWKLIGEPTEGALRTLGRKARFDDSPYERLADLPFESETKFMATLNRTPSNDLKIFVKGAPDRLLDRCGRQRAANGSLEPLHREFWEQKIEALSNDGLRVLAAAARDVPRETKDLSVEDLDDNLVFLGVVGILDPPRPEAIEAINVCRQAGIRVKMITGDHVGTASAIGKEMGIGDGLHAITGSELEAASDSELRRIADENDIFARTSPEHKLRLVKALQANGHVVAMTGDGVNDAPALKRADVGVAMGIKGTEATKEAAEIVLADDNFASIERAVEEGRTIYDNLRKAILFILPTNGAQSIVIFVAIIFGLVLPLTPVQVLWVNMITTVTLALALAFEPAEPGLMQRPPRDPGAGILNGHFLWRVAFVSILIGGGTMAVFLRGQASAASLELARTVAVNTLVIGQLFYLFNSRFLQASSFRVQLLFSNRAVWIAVGTLVLLQLLFVYAPFMNHWFGTAPMPLHQWLAPIAIGATVFVAVEAEKALFRKLRPVTSPSPGREETPAT